MEKPMSKSSENSEFMAALPLAVCVQHILDMKKPAVGILNPGVDPVAEKIDESQYRFHLYNRYDRYKRRPQAFFYLEGSLKGQGTASTAVTAQLQTGWLNLILSVVASLVIVSVVALFAPPPIRPVLIFVPLIFWALFIPRMYADARALLRRLDHTLNGHPAP